MKRRRRVFPDWDGTAFAAAIADLPERKRWQAVELVILDLTEEERAALEKEIRNESHV